MDRSCRTHAFSWEDLKTIIGSNELELLGRSEQQQAEYMAFRQTLDEEWCSVRDYILCTKFEVPVSSELSEGKKKALVMEQQQGAQAAKPRLVVLVNDYPYHFEPHIAHYILWKGLGNGGGEEVTEAEIEATKTSLRLSLQVRDCLHYVNPPHLKSIPEIDHVHILLHLSSSLLLPSTEQGIAQAAELLAQNKLVAFPTETVYGLGANALNEAAVLSIFEAKGRPLTDPLIVHVVDQAAAAALVCFPIIQEQEGGGGGGEGDRVFDTLGGLFWPGPLTIIAPAASCIPPVVTAHTGSVGVRVPAHPLAMKLLRACRLPIAAPSANRFGHVSPTRATHVLADLAEKGVRVLDGEGQGEEQEAPATTCEHGIESTVAKIDALNKRIMIFRQGAISQSQIEQALLPNFSHWSVEAVVRTVKMHATSSSSSSSSSSTNNDEAEAGAEETTATTGGQEAPGQAITHYAPDVPCVVVLSLLVVEEEEKGGGGKHEGNGENYLALSLSKELSSCVVLDFGAQLFSLKEKGALAYRDLSAQGNSTEAARHLFDALRWAEQQQGARRVLLASAAGAVGDMTAGLCDRMFRAASGVSVSLSLCS